MMIKGTYPAARPTPAEPKAGMRTPWGTAQSVTKKAAGIHEISCAGHGGFKLGRHQNACVDPAWRRAGGWYEEDCEWAIVGLTFGTDAGFSLAAVEDCRSTCKNYFPDAYETIYGVKVTAEESHVVREREAKAAAKGQLQIIACYGDWATNVPKGMVGVVATVDGDRTSVAESLYFVITSEQYEAGSGPVRVLPEGATPVPAGDRKAGPFAPR